MSDGNNKIKLLIVDDEKGFAEVLGKRMGRRGILVEIAYRGEDAVRMLREKEFDVAVLDLKLEGMDGIEVLKVFKMLDPDLPVLMLTGHGCEKSVAESFRLGVADYLSKPVDFNLLLEKVRQVCSRKGESMTGIRILLVDDEINFSRVLARRLDKRGMSVQTALSGYEAMQMLKVQEVDVVLLDIKMPGRDGVQLLSEIKRLYPHIEVVMLTAHINPDLVISSLAMGAYDYLLKPADVDELVSKIGDAAERRKKDPDGVQA